MVHLNKYVTEGCFMNLLQFFVCHLHVLISLKFLPFCNDYESIECIVQLQTYEDVWKN